METLDLSVRVKKLRQQNKQIWDCGLGESPLPAPIELVGLMRAHAERNEYTPLGGVDGLASEIVIRLGQDHRILFGNGLKELILAIQGSHFNHQGGAVVHVTPCWPSYFRQVQCLAKLDKLVEIHTSFSSGWKLQPKQLDDALEGIERPLLVFNSPCNPTSVVYDGAELAALAVVLQKHGAVVLADEIYGQIGYFDTPSPSISDYFTRTIRCSSISKDLGCGGFKLGWAAFPPCLSDLCGATTSFCAAMYSSPSAPIQYAFRDFLKLPGAYERSLQNTRIYFRVACQRLCDLLSTTRLRYLPPRGAYYLFVDFNPYSDALLNRRGCRDDVALCKLLEDEVGLVALHGSAFRTPWPMCVRLSVVADARAQDEGAERLRRWLSNL